MECRYDEVIHYEETAPYAKTAHPTPDHFLPLLVALGAAGEDATSKLINHGWELLCFSMACFEFKHVF
ncbi:hypothetical protein O6H91_Y228600 [Diphasiastrum complanatum]|nr:hypothetical protein O6H91_Y228600 [Diphasiastrum complanatum]